MAREKGWDATRGCLCGEQAASGANVQGRIQQRPVSIVADKNGTAMSCGGRLSKGAAGMTTPVAHSSLPAPTCEQSLAVRPDITDGIEFDSAGHPAGGPSVLQANDTSGTVQAGHCSTWSNEAMLPTLQALLHAGPSGLNAKDIIRRSQELGVHDWGWRGEEPVSSNLTKRVLALLKEPELPYCFVGSWAYALNLFPGTSCKPWPKRGREDAGAGDCPGAMVPAKFLTSSEQSCACHMLGPASRTHHAVHPGLLLLRLPQTGRQLWLMIACLCR